MHSYQSHVPAECMAGTCPSPFSCVPNQGYHGAGMQLTLVAGSLVLPEEEDVDSGIAKLASSYPKTGVMLLAPFSTVLLGMKYLQSSGDLVHAGSSKR